MSTRNNKKINLKKHCHVYDMTRREGDSSTAHCKYKNAHNKRTLLQRRRRRHATSFPHTHTHTHAHNWPTSIHKTASECAWHNNLVFQLFTEVVSIRALDCGACHVASRIVCCALCMCAVPRKTVAQRTPACAQRRNGSGQNRRRMQK